MYESDTSIVLDETIYISLECISHVNIHFIWNYMHRSYHSIRFIFNQNEILDTSIESKEIYLTIEQNLSSVILINSSFNKSMNLLSITTP